MKHYLTSLCLMAGIFASAAVLTPEEALQRVYSSQSGSNRIPGRHQTELFNTINQTDGTPAAYIFSNSLSGWMLVSASDATSPLLGYGDRFDPAVPMPPQMEWWLSQYAGQIRLADSIASVTPQRLRNPATDASPRRKADRSPISPLMTTYWNQLEPYNRYCPKVNGEKTPTGCVATAISQVMNHHKYPEAGQGMGYATAGNQELSLELNTPIEWNDMLDQYWFEDEYTEQQADAVANLMLTVGYACNMNYAPEGSGAYDLDANKALVDNLTYANSAWTYYRDHYETGVWEDMLYEELASDRPVYYSGRSEGGGHAFVCDGYEGNGYFHFNWGWGGWFDGMFLIDALNPEGQGTGGFEGGYNTDQMAIMGIQPPTGHDTMPEARLTMFDPLTCDIQEGFITLIAGWYNMSYRENEYDIAIELVNSLTGDSWYVEESSASLAPRYGYSTYSAYISPTDFPEGDYTMQLVTMSGGQEWLPALHPYWLDSSVSLHNDGTSWNALQALPLQINDVSIVGSLDVNTPSLCNVTVENPGSFQASDTYAAYLTRLDGNQLYIVAKTDPSDYLSVTLDPYQTETLEMPFTLQVVSNDFAYNTDLYFVIADPQTLAIDFNLGVVQIEHTVIDPESIKIEPTEVTLNNGESIKLNVTILPEEAAADALVGWSTSDSSVVYVEDAYIIAQGPGEAIVIATTHNGLTAQCQVRVLQEVTKVNISETRLRLAMGETAQLEATVSPENASDQSIVWSSEDPSVATVSETGFVTAVGVGETNIVATASNGKYAKCNTRVKAIEPESIYLDMTALTIDAGDSQTLHATITPEDATNQELTWTTSDSGVATVEDGVVTGVAGGACTVKATTVNGLEAACEVTVREKATGIELSETELNLEVGETHQLTVTFYPETTTERHITWVTSDASVATVEDGLVTVVGVGTARIKATYALGISATCVVNATADVDVLLADGATCDVYTVTGILVRRDATRHDIERLTPDVYILRRGDTAVKLHLP